MEIDDLLAALSDDGRSLAAAAQRQGLDAPVRSCPGWRVRDVLTHLGAVHRWATGIVVEGRSESGPRMGEEEVLHAGPQDSELLAWFLEGHSALVEALRAATPNLECWTFLAAPSPRMFWAGRQAHETAVHRADVEGAGGPVTPFAAHFAADGVDELIMGFARTRRSTGRSATPRTLMVAASDTDQAWRIHFGPDRVATELGHGSHDCSLSALASDLYLILWNRAEMTSSPAEVHGDPELVELWHESLRIRWS